jgi:hypothetical protein
MVGEIELSLIMPKTLYIFKKSMSMFLILMQLVFFVERIKRGCS